MTKAQHTPGPWINNHQGAIEACDRVICRVMDGYTTPTIKEAIANARLIAAAPELLKALKRWHEFAANNGYTDDDFKTESTGWISETAAAIAKATGE